MSNQEFESIITKARKINELVERGIQGEAEAAKRKLDLLMNKYGLTTDDISTEATQDYDFRIQTPEEKSVLIHIAMVVCGTQKIRSGYYEKGNKKVRREMWITLTPRQYVELSEMWIWHLKQFRKELKAMRQSLVTAYVNKHRLFAQDHSNSGAEISLEEMMRLQAMMASLDDSVKYRKAIIA